MDKKKQMVFNLNNFLLSMSMALDGVEIDLYKVSENHSKRVAYLALKLAQEFNYSQEGLFDVCAYSLCHNIGLNETLEKDISYCELSQKYANKLPFLSNEENILKYQQEHYAGSGLYGLKGSEIPLFSQFICFADTLDEKFDLSKNSIENRIEVIDFVKKNEKILFSEDIVECFIEFSASSSFWLDLQSENDILNYIFGTLHDFTTTPSFEEILEITSIFTNVIEKDTNIITKSEKLLDYYNFEHKDKQTFLIAASLSNLGKLVLPRSIIKKETFLDLLEYETMKSYPFYTKKILNNIIGFSDIVVLTSKVQETMDGQGYPFNYEAKELSFKDRLLASIVMYNALTLTKAYREAFSHDEAIALMNDLAVNNKLDESIISDINEVFK